jgi:glutaredoxin
MKKSIILYTTLGCHLCEEAEQLLNQVEIPENTTIQKRDIIDNQQWLDKYRISIPVLASNGKELNWPFTKIQIQQFLQKL